MTQRFAEYADHDALGLAELVRTNQISPAELVEEAIRRIESVNPRINAVVHTMYEHARALASQPLPEGPFTGVPFLVKDLLATYAGQPMSFGSRAMRGYVPAHDSSLVERFKAAGVITVGKTNLSELGLSPTTEPLVFGPTHNPWDPARTPSGSSGGSAAAVAARMVPMASGGDGGGSIRTPASACGVFGLKPSRGRNPVGPDIGEIWHGAVAEHVLTRTVRDSAAMLDATAGPDAGAPYFAPAPERPFLSEVSADPGRLRIAYTTDSLLGTQVDQVCVDAVQETVTLLEELGHELIPARPDFDRRRFMRAYISLVASETAADLEEMAELTGQKRVRPRDVELGTRVLALLGQRLGGGAFVAANRHLQRVSRAMGVFLESYDAFLTPTLSRPPIITGGLQPNTVENTALRVLERLGAGNTMKAMGVIDAIADKVFGFSAFAPLFNVSGQPAMSVPIAWSPAGLPVGMHFAARYAGEAVLFRLAGQLERARPWIARRPAVCAE